MDLDLKTKLETRVVSGRLTDRSVNRNRNDFNQINRTDNRIENNRINR